VTSNAIELAAFPDRPEYERHPATFQHHDLVTDSCGESGVTRGRARPCQFEKMVLSRVAARHLRAYIDFQASITILVMG
jgi:hypothetical protein